MVKEVRRENLDRRGDKRSCEYLKMGYMKKGQKPSNTCKSPTIKNQLDQACN